MKELIFLQVIVFHINKAFVTVLFKNSFETQSMP